MRDRILNSVNFHCSQAKISNIDYTRILDDNFPQEKYKRRSCENKTTVKFGQLKLLISEIEFICICIDELKTKIDIVCVYAGAAPGIHIPQLARMFPFINFILYDPVQFAFSSHDNIKTNNMKFSNTQARQISKKYKNKTILFISDIRTIRDGDKSFVNLDQSRREELVESDLSVQAQWVKLIRPFKSLLKFRLPFDTKKTYRYLNGIILFQAYEGRTSSETRLLVPYHFTSKIYDPITFENQLYYFNTHNRCCIYKHDIIYNGLDHCYDCYTLIHILKLYIEMNKEYNFGTSKNIYNLLDDIYKHLNANNKTIYCTLDGHIYSYQFSSYDNKKIQLKHSIECKTIINKIKNIPKYDL